MLRYRHIRQLAAGPTWRRIDADTVSINGLVSRLHALTSPSGGSAHHRFGDQHAAAVLMFQQQ